MEEQSIDRGQLHHSFKTYSRWYTCRVMLADWLRREILCPHLSTLYAALRSIMNTYLLIPSQIFRCFLKSNILIKCIPLIVQPIRTKQIVVKSPRKTKELMFSKHWSSLSFLNLTAMGDMCRAWAGMLHCTSHYPGRLCQVQHEQEPLQPFCSPHTLALGGREGTGCPDLTVGWKWDAQMSELRSSGKVSSATLWIWHQ